MNKTNHLEKPIYGTTIFIGSMSLEMQYGKFHAYVYQDFKNKAYIVALLHGDIRTKTLRIRLHSSCVTSETLRSMDCDCVKQLEGALEVIAKSDGILFYLMQEGRGCGYVGKSRSCMNVQYLNDTIGTFESYQSLGMQNDYRDYRNVYDICHLLGITSSDFILLTNNPDKIKRFTELGLNLIGIESIEIKPNPFNLTYLHSKKSYGHLLYQTKEKVTNYNLPYERIKLFTPYSLENAERFVHVSSYYLPIKPINDQIIMSNEEWDLLKGEIMSGIEIKSLDKSRMMITVHDKSLYQTHSDIANKPYWFRVDVYYDIQTSTEYIVLVYGEGTKPIIRIHSESIFNRFPLKNRKYRERYKTSVEEIVKHGYGIIFLLQIDGRGSGLGFYVLNKTSDGNIGINADTRDYDGTILLIKKYVQDRIDLICGETSKTIMMKKLKEHGINVEKCIPVNCDKNENYNRQQTSIDRRIKNSLSYIESCKISPVLDTYNKMYITGIGSSEAHAIYLAELLGERATFIPLSKIESIHIPCILFSQGLSPNIKICLETLNYQCTVVTSVTNTFHNKERVETFEKIRGKIINYPVEEEDNTLIRISGPIGCFFVAQQIARKLGVDCMNSESFLKSCHEINLRVNNNIDRLTGLIDIIAMDKTVCIIIDNRMKKLMTNIINKFTEGCYINPYICGDLDFGHGMFQCLEAKRQEGLRIAIINLSNLSDKMFPKYHVFSYKMMEVLELLPIELEMLFNQIVSRLITQMNIDQRTWPGKEEQHIFYNRYSKNI